MAEDLGAVAMSQFGGRLAYVRAPDTPDFPDARSALPDAEQIDQARALIEAQVLVLHHSGRISLPQLYEALDHLAGRDAD